MEHRDTWFASVTPDTGIRVLQNDPRMTIICEIPAAHTNKEAVRDARLIAAAPEMFTLVDRVADLNPDAGEIGAGMLVQLVTEARAARMKALQP